MNEKRRIKFFVLGAGLVMLVLCFVVAGLAPDGTFRLDTVTMPDDRHGQDSQPGPPPQTSRGDQPVASGPNHDATPDPEGTRDAPEPTDADRQDVGLRIRCQTTDGQAIPGVKLHFRLLSQRPGGGARVRVLDEGDITTDAHGEVSLTGQPEWGVAVDLLESNWYAARCEVGLSDTGPIVMILSPASDVRVLAMYDDGEPVRYMGVLFDPAGRSFSKTFALSSDGVADVPGVPVDKPLKCTIFSGRRTGYENCTIDVTQDEVQSGRTIEIVVTKGASKFARIRVEYSNELNLLGTIVMVESEKGHPLFGRIASAGTTWESDEVWAGRRYRVSFLGPLAWRSDWIETTAGETSVLTAELAECGKVRVRLVEENGTPISNGCLRVSSGAYLEYQPGSPPVPRMPPAWLSDKDGFVTLDGIPAGTVRVEAEAWGREPVQREVEVLSGHQHELGDIVLSMALGEVTVQLTGMKPERKYVALIAGPDDIPIFPPRAVDGDTCKLDSLPLRKCVVVVTLKGGGTVVTQEIILSSASPSVTVVLDVASITE